MANLGTARILPGAVGTGTAEVVVADPVAEAVRHADIALAGDAAGRRRAGALARHPGVYSGDRTVGVVACRRDHYCPGKRRQPQG